MGIAISVGLSSSIFLRIIAKRLIEEVVAAFSFSFFFVKNASSRLTSYNAINSEYVRQGNCRIRDRMFLVA